MAIGGCRVAWKVHRLSAAIASVRYRCLLPLLALRTLGVSSHVFEEGETLTDLRSLDALIFVKSFTESDLALARRAAESGVPIVLDLCDNIFIAAYAADGIKNPAKGFSAMAPLARAVVVPTAELARVVRQATGFSGAIVVIPDQVETENAVLQLLDNAAPALLFGRELVIPTALARLPAVFLRGLVPPLRRALWALDRRGHRGALYRLPRRLKALASLRAVGRGSVQSEPPALPVEGPVHEACDRKRVIWFGMHGASHSRFGIETLEDLLPVLKEVNELVPIELRIVSNSIAKFMALTANMPFPCTYVRWSVRGIFTELRESDVCVIPNVWDDFSVCKSPNRATLALSLGVPVVATGIPSFQVLAGCTALDQWHEGVLAYLTDESRRERDLAAAQKVIDETFSPEVISRHWLRVIGSLRPHEEVDVDFGARRMHSRVQAPIDISIGDSR